MSKLGAFDAYIQDAQEKAEIERQNVAASESDIDAEPLALEPHVTHPQQIEATETL